MILASSSPKSEMSSEPASFESAMMACARIGGSLSRTRSIKDERNSVYKSSLCIRLVNGGVVSRAKDVLDLSKLRDEF